MFSPFFSCVLYDSLFLQVIHDSVTYTEHAKWKMVTALNVVIYTEVIRSYTVQVQYLIISVGYGIYFFIPVLIFCIVVI